MAEFLDISSQPQTQLPPQTPTPAQVQTQAEAQPLVQASSSAPAPPGQVPAPVPAATSVSPSPIPECIVHKNRLQQFTQRSSMPMPIYEIVNEGSQHAPKFRAKVFVDGVTFTSLNTFPHRKEAEQDVAKLALECVLEKVKGEEYPLICQDTVFCKSILNEFAVKMNLQRPAYSTSRPEGLLPVFVSSVVFNGTTYTGHAGKNKKEAEQLAARAVIIHLLGASEYGTTLPEIIKSKMKLYAALHMVKGSQELQSNAQTVNVSVSSNNGEAETVLHNAVATSAKPEEILNMYPPRHEFIIPKPAPSSQNTILPIAFVQPVSAEPHADVGLNSSKKRRKNKKKANKKLCFGARLPIAAPSQNQAPCSAVQ